MEPIVGPAGMLAKYAPIFFLVVKNGGGFKLDIEKIAHTLIVAVIVALVTRYETVRVIEVRMEHLDRSVQHIAAMAEEAIKVQRETIPVRNLQVKTLQDEVKTLDERVARIEQRRGGKL